jgi:hypothetical protein
VSDSPVEKISSTAHTSLAIRVSDLLFWHDKLPNIWNELVSLVQDVFDGKAIPQEFSYEILCLIPKED